MFCGSGYDRFREFQPPGMLAQKRKGAWVLAINGAIVRKFGRTEMAAYPKADSLRLLVFIFMLLLLPLCACTAGNSDAAADAATRKEATGGSDSEGSSLESSEAIFNGSSETAQPATEGTTEGSNAGASTFQPDQVTQAEMEGIGNYTLVKGEEYPICKEFLDNLNFYKGKGETPMACDMRIAPQFEKFKTLNWEDMPIEGNEEFLKNLVYDRFSGPFSADSEESLDNRWKQFYSRYLGKYKYPNVEISISKAPVQIFKDRRKNYALRLHYKDLNTDDCGYDGGNNLSILADNQRIDPDSFPFSQGAGQSGGGLFYYDGKIRNFETAFNDNISSRDPYPFRKVYPAVVRLYDIMESTHPTYSTLLRRQEICVYTYE